MTASPPYLGMRYYVSDQWLRNWFLGARDDVQYDESQQLGSRTPETFLSELAHVWRKVAAVGARSLFKQRRVPLYNFLARSSGPLIRSLRCRR
jgi:hypothetical protein